MKTIIFGDKKIIIRKIELKDLKIPNRFQDFINSFLKEDVYLLVNTKKSKKDELEWLSGRIKQNKQKKCVSLIAEHNGVIIGSCHIELQKERKNHLGEFGIAIKRGYRGMGVGKYLMQAVLELAKTCLKPKPKIIELGVYEGNLPALNLYKKMGFKRVARIPNHIQYKGRLIAEIIMQLDLR